MVIITDPPIPTSRVPSTPRAFNEGLYVIPESTLTVSIPVDVEFSTKVRK